MTIASRTTTHGTSRSVRGAPSGTWPVLRLAVPAALAAAALVGCGSTATSGSSGTSSSSSSSAPTSAASPTSTPGVGVAQLQAVGKCLKDAGLPTPTSTEPSEAVKEAVQMLKDPRTLAALRGCGIDIPSLQRAATST